jgi:hypothetical protein
MEIALYNRKTLIKETEGLPFEKIKIKRKCFLDFTIA